MFQRVSLDGESLVGPGSQARNKEHLESIGTIFSQLESFGSQISMEGGRDYLQWQPIRRNPNVRKRGPRRGGNLRRLMGQGHLLLHLTVKGFSPRDALTSTPQPQILIDFLNKSVTMT